MIGQARASVAFSNLVQSYDGSPKPVIATTAPAGLTVDLTYDGSSRPPTRIGSYRVVGTINDQRTLYMRLPNENTSEAAVNALPLACSGEA